MKINNIVLGAIRFGRIGYYHLYYCGGAVKSLSFVAAAGHIGLFAKNKKILNICYAAASKQ